MPNSALKAAIKEAYARARVNEVYLDTIELSHPDIGTPIYLVADRQDQVLTLEGGGGAKTFKACAFRMTLPPSGENGIQDLHISIDNVKQQGDSAMTPAQFVNTVKASRTKVTVTYRPYLASDHSQPQTDPPLQLALSDVEVNGVEISGRCSFADVVNMSFATELYVRSRFKSLGN